MKNIDEMKNFTPSPCMSSRQQLNHRQEDLNSWLNEIELLLTNLEHLSTKELQLKYDEVQVNNNKQKKTNLFKAILTFV